MKILLSPSKTKEIKGLPTADLFSQAVTAQIVHHMQNLTVEEIGKALKIKEAKAVEVSTFFKEYEAMPAGEAGSTYTGLAFKNLSWQTLPEEDKAFAIEHLYILSALYGLVKPNSPVKEYRLDLVDKIFKDSKNTLYDWWQEPLQEALSGEDWLLNLASKEYSKLVTVPRMLTVEFWEEKNGQWKQLSTTSKQMRGRYARYVIENRVLTPAQLPTRLADFCLVGTLPKTCEERLTLAYRRQA